MKIWQAYGSEHSANLVIVGTFKAVDDAKDAEALLKGIRDLYPEGQQPEKPVIRKKTPEEEEMLKKHHGGAVHTIDLYELTNDFYNIVRDGDKVAVRTDAWDVGAVIKCLYQNGGRVEVHSVHDHPGGPYDHLSC